MQVWDPLVRILHWSLLLTVTAAWLTRHGFGRTHEWIGYIPLGLVMIRLLWGFGQSHYARFTQFVRPPAAVIKYLQRVLSGTAERYIGHNPLGGWMTLALLVTVATVCLSGWLYTTDRYWGIEWVETLHRVTTNVLLTLVGIHIAGVVWTSIKGGENLVAAMVHGKKRAASESDVDN